VEALGKDLLANTCFALNQHADVAGRDAVEQAQRTFHLGLTCRAGHRRMTHHRLVAHDHQHRPPEKDDLAGDEDRCFIRQECATRDPRAILALEILNPDRRSNADPRMLT
jgi:hypothetical protein